MISKDFTLAELWIVERVSILRRECLAELNSALLFNITVTGLARKICSTPQIKNVEAGCG